MILDTNAVTGILAGDTNLATVLSSEPRHHLPVVVIGEYRYGLMNSALRDRLEPLFDRLIRESRVLIVEEDTATQYAEIRSALRRQGRPIPENDLWIAALSREHCLPIVSRDAHFDRIDGIERLAW
jgi:tRNA(fMet)-specific endonuclease VapC